MTRKMQNTASEDKAKSKYRRVMPTRIVYTGKPPELEEPDDLELDDGTPFNFTEFNFTRYLNEKKWLMAVLSYERDKNPLLLIDQISHSNLPPEVKKLLSDLLKNSHKPDIRKNSYTRQFLAAQRLIAFEAGHTSDISHKSQRTFRTKKELIEYLASEHDLAANTIEKRLPAWCDGVFL